MHSGCTSPPDCRMDQRSARRQSCHSRLRGERRSATACLGANEAVERPIARRADPPCGGAQPGHATNPCRVALAPRWGRSLPPRQLTSTTWTPFTKARQSSSQCMHQTDCVTSLGVFTLSRSGKIARVLACRVGGREQANIWIGEQDSFLLRFFLVAPRLTSVRLGRNAPA